MVLVVRFMNNAALSRAIMSGRRRKRRKLLEKSQFSQVFIHLCFLITKLLERKCKFHTSINSRLVTNRRQARPIIKGPYSHLVIATN